MEKERKSSAAYLMQLAGKYKLHLLVSALFGIASALCSFIPYVMVYRSILVLLGGEGNALHYGLIAAAAIAGKFSAPLFREHFLTLEPLTRYTTCARRSAGTLQR